MVKRLVTHLGKFCRLPIELSLGCLDLAVEVGLEYIVLLIHLGQRLRLLLKLGLCGIQLGLQVRNLAPKLGPLLLDG